MIRRFRCTMILLASASLCSCAFVKAVTLPEARGKPGGELELTLFMFAPSTTRGSPTPPDEVAKLPEHVRDYCTSPPRTQPPEPEVGPILGIVAVTAFTLGFGELTSALTGYVKAKSKRFAPAPYAARANVPAFRFLPGRGQQEAALRCIRLVRTIREDDKSIKASDVIISFERPRQGRQYANTGMVGILRHFELQRFAASTRDRETTDQMVKATVGIAFSLLSETEGSDVRDIATFDQFFVIPAAKLGEVIVDNFEESQTPMLSSTQTAIMPEPSGQPATIAISIAEAGEGVEEFDAFNDAQFNATAKVLGDALGNILKLKILPNQP